MDVVWVFLLILVYVWGGAVPGTEMSACTDGICTLQVALHDARAFASAHDVPLFETLNQSYFLSKALKYCVQRKNRTFIFGLGNHCSTFELFALSTVLLFGPLLAKRQGSKKK